MPMIGMFEDPRFAAGTRTVAQAMAATRASKVVTVQPQVERRPDGRLVRIPVEAGYGVSEYFVATGQPTASGRA